MFLFSNPIYSVQEIYFSRLLIIFSPFLILSFLEHYTLVSSVSSKDSVFTVFWTYYASTKCFQQNNDYRTENTKWLRFWQNKREKDFLKIGYFSQGENNKESNKNLLYWFIFLGEWLEPWRKYVTVRLLFVYLLENVDVKKVDFVLFSRRLKWIYF